MELKSRTRAAEELEENSKKRTMLPIITKDGLVNVEVKKDEEDEDMETDEDEKENGKNVPEEKSVLSLMADREMKVKDLKILLGNLAFWTIHRWVKWEYVERGIGLGKFQCYSNLCFFYRQRLSALS